MALKINKKTVSEQIVDHFKEKIESGELKPGDAFPSERKLEKELNISRKTINKAVSILAGQGYLFKEQGKATFVADFRKAAALSTGIENYGFLFNSPNCVYHPATAPLFRELCQTATLQERGVKLIFGENLQDYTAFKEIQGLFVFGGDLKLDFNLLENLNLPLVIFNRSEDSPKSLKACWVYPDIVDALRQAVIYLKEQGHSRIAFLYGVETWVEDIKRIDAFKKVMVECGCEPDESMILASNYNRDVTVKAVEEVLKHKPTAIIGADDMVARWVIDCLEPRGKKVPDDISVIGFNNMEMYSLRSPKLTTFQNNFIKMAEIAGNYMFSGAEHENVRNPVKFDFIERESVKKLS